MIALLRQRNFALLWFGQLMSLIGDWVLAIALPFYIYELTGSALATSLMLVAQFLPSVALGSLAGVFIDRWDRRRTMIAIDLVRAITLLALLQVRSPDWLWLVYGVAFLQSALGQFFVPAKSAIIPRLVNKEDLIAANAANGMSDSLTRLAGAAAGGALMALFGLTGVVLVDSASFLASAVLICLIRIVPLSGDASSIAQSGKPTPGDLQKAKTPRGSFRREWLEGLLLIRSDRLLTGLFVVAGIMMFADSIFTALIVVYVKDMLGAGTLEFGWLMAAQGVGGVAGGLLLVTMRRSLTPERLIGLAGIGNGLILLTIFNVPLFWLAITLIVPAGVLLVAGSASLQTLLQGSVADVYRGRIFGIFGAMAAMMRLGGLALAGALGDALGAVVLLSIGGGLWFVAGALCMVILARPVPVAAEAALQPVGRPVGS